VTALAEGAVTIRALPESFEAEGTADDPRQRIQHEQSNIAPSVDASLDALAAHGSIYVSGDRLVQVSRATSKDAERSVWKDSRGRSRYAVRSGSPHVTPPSPGVLKLRLSEAAAGILGKFSAGEGSRTPDLARMKRPL
jgi:hypothetical protein